MLIYFMSLLDLTLRLFISVPFTSFSSRDSLVVWCWSLGCCFAKTKALSNSVPVIGGSVQYK